MHKTKQTSYNTKEKTMYSGTDKYLS